MSLYSDEYYKTSKTEDQFDKFWYNYITITHNKTNHKCNINDKMDLFNRISEHMCNTNFQFTQAHKLIELDVELLMNRKAMHKALFKRPHDFYR